MKRLDVEVSDFVHARFVEYAKAKKRSKRAQLAWMIEEALKAEGMLDENSDEQKIEEEYEKTKKAGSQEGKTSGE